MLLFEFKKMLTEKNKKQIKEKFGSIKKFFKIFYSDDQLTNFQNFLKNQNSFQFSDSFKIINKIIEVNEKVDKIKNYFEKSDVTNIQSNKRKFCDVTCEKDENVDNEEERIYFCIKIRKI
jgi:hypothetical protein